MEKLSGKQLLQKLKDGSISPEERALLESWYLHYAEQSRPFDDVDVYRKDIAELYLAFPFNKAKASGAKLWSRISIAATASFLLFGLWFFTADHGILKDKHSNLVENDLPPGSRGGTLTLANGQQIRLTEAMDGQLAEQAGVSIRKTKDGQLIYEVNERTATANQTNTLSTAKGETYKVRLPDGSEVWLNAASSLTYNTILESDGKRRVSLSGEGYFEVAKNKAYPFIVETRGQQIEVLGTHFNINSYSDEPVAATTLLEGSVRIEDAQNHVVTLRPGQQATLRNNALTVLSVDTEEAVAWKDGSFLFSGQNLESIMRQVARWYDVDIVFEDDAIKDEIFRGSISRFENISQLLEVLEKTGSVHFKVKGRRVIAIK